MSDLNIDVASIVQKVVGELSGEKKPHVCKCGKRMSLAIAKALAKRVEKKAEELSVKAVIAVVDSGANPVLIHCMDDSYIASFDIALNKAFTSAGLKMSTAEVGRLSQPNGPLYGIQQTNGGRIVIFGGGEPLELNGKIIGAIGVSGGTLEQDTQLGEYAKGIFEEVVKCL